MTNYFTLIVGLGLGAGYGVTMKEILERVRNVELNQWNQLALIIAGALGGAIGVLYSTGNIMNQITLSSSLGFSFASLAAVSEIYIESYIRRV